MNMEKDNINTNRKAGWNRGGNRGRGIGRGGNKGRSSTSLSVTNKHNDNIKSEESEAMKRRRERFTEGSDKDKSKEKDKVNYGLISRGEDMRLITEKEARDELYKTTIAMSEDSDERLLGLRKLRECVLALGSKSKSKSKSKDELDVEFARDIFLCSLQQGKIEAYLPAVGGLLEPGRMTLWGISNIEQQEVWAICALHRAIIEEDWEGAVFAAERGGLEVRECVRAAIVGDIFSVEQLVGRQAGWAKKWLGIVQEKRKAVVKTAYRGAESMGENAGGWFNKVEV
jgi:hypothetical protein